MSLSAALIWLLSGIAVWKPEITMKVARLLGIGRGADLVLYVFVIFFIAAFFYFQGQFQRLESHLTTIVRHLALSDPTNVRSRGEARRRAAGPEDSGSHE